MPTETASAVSPIQVAPGEFMTVEDFQNLVLVKGTDEVFKRGFDPENYPFQGDMLYDNQDLKSRTYTTQTTVGMGNVPRNRDGESIPADTQSEGFSHTLTSYMYRQKASWTRELIEDNLYPEAISDNSMELMDASRRTVEEIMADGVNRCLGTSGAPFLCEDGRYWIDSARNNPHPLGGTWSNLEATAALSVSAMFTAQLNARLNKNARGQKKMLRLETIIIRPNEEKTMQELTKSTLEPTTALNKINYGSQFGYTVYDHMTTAQVLYKLSGTRNEIRQLWRIRPEVSAVPVTDPDTFSVRVRFRFGLGGLRPDAWRGGALS